ncbi:hypothetical protein V8G54_010631 [Vigna mungo]|uniref:Uncharacterized protein n=1 Tax=Vigna mungo TaxID=3915 RepID=A0AAQ3S395_VIGMU
MVEIHGGMINAKLKCALSFSDPAKKKAATAVAVDSRLSPTIKTSLQLYITGLRLRRSNKPLDWLDVRSRFGCFRNGGVFAFSDTGEEDGEDTEDIGGLRKKMNSQR